MRKITIFCLILFVISVIVAGASWFMRDRLKQGATPVITMDEPSIEIPVGADDATILQGVTAYDEEDGDLTDQLLVEGLSRFISTGRRTARIGVVDSSNKVSEINREIIYTNYESPKFSLTAPLIFSVGTSKLDGVIMATDMIDGDISGKIRMNTEASDLGERAGTYRATFTASNSLGDSVEIPLTITYDNNASDSTFPKITLTDYLVYIKKGEWITAWEFVDSLTAERKTYERNGDVLRIPGTEPETTDEDEATEGEDEDNDEEEEEVDDPNVIEYDELYYTYGGFNNSVPGVYEINYYYTDSQDRTGRTCLVIVVEEAE